MKPSRSVISAGLVLAALSQFVHAETFPIFEDAAGSPTPTTGTISAAAGKAKTLAVSAKSSAFINFAVSNGQGDPIFNIDPATVTGARLVIFLAKASKTGTLTVSNLATGFTESPTTKTIPSPTLGTVLGTIPLASFTPSLNADFFIIDITTQVKSWLTNFNPNTEFGIAISSDGTATATLASKEGAGSGHPAVIEIDINKGGGTVSGTTAVFTGGVTAGSFSSTAGDFSAAGNVALSPAANRTVSVTPEPSNGTNGHSLTIKAGNAVSGAQARTGGDLILEAGSGFNINQAGLDGGDLILRSGGNTRTTASTDDGGDIIFQVGSFNSTFIEKARLLESGNFGIGTATPEDLLHVNSAGGTRTLISTTTATFAGVRTRSSAREYFTGLSSNGTDFILQDNTAGATRLRVLPNGNVGIGTNTPTQAILVVNGAVSNNFNGATVGFLSPNTSGSGFAGGQDSISIMASNEIWATAFLAFSDARTKNVQGHSDGAADLQTLSSIEITDYLFKDVIGKGSRPQKKVIAQQVEKVYPQAVNRSTNVVPDIYEKAGIADGWVALATDLKVGDRVRLIAKTTEGIHEVLEVEEGRFRTDFQPEGAEVFVYGREVNDFRSVDYEAIAMLNVSATQELARKLETKDAEIAALKQKVAALEARDAAREARLTRLESALDAGPAHTVRASVEFK